MGPARVGELLGFNHVYPSLALATWSVLFRWGSAKSPHQFFSSPWLLALVVVSRAPTLARGVTNDSQLGNYISNISWGTIINFFVLALTKGLLVNRGLGCSWLEVHTNDVQLPFTLNSMAFVTIWVAIFALVNPSLWYSETNAASNHIH